MSSENTEPCTTFPRALKTEGWRFVASGKEYKVDQFYQEYKTCFPCVAIVTAGFYGEIGIEIIGNGQTIYIQKLVTQQRVVAEVLSGLGVRQLSIPTAYRARFCILDKYGADSKEYPLAEILRLRNLPCDVKFSPKNQFSLVSVEGTNMATNNLRLRLLWTYDELYLVGNPITMNCIYPDLMLVPFYLEDLRLSLVTGIQGYPGPWSSYLGHLSVANLSDSVKHGNSDIAVYKKTGLKSFESSSAVPQTYLTVSDVRGSKGHHYEDIQVKQQTDKIYDILWDAHSGVPVMKERPNDKMTSREEKRNRRYVDWKDAKLSASVNSNPVKEYASRPLPKLPKNAEDETKIPTKANTLPSNSKYPHGKQERKLSEPTVKSITTTEADTRVQKQNEKQQYHKAGQYVPSKAEIASVISEGKIHVVSEKNPSVERSEPPRPKRAVMKSMAEDLMAPNQSAQRRELVPHMSVSDVQYWLKALRLEQYAGVFLENEIDGALLLELDNGVLIGEFGMSRFHAIKLRKFATEGYMPRQ